MHCLVKASEVRTPSKSNKIYFFMAALSKKGSKVKALGFWAEHKDGTSWGALKDYMVSVDRLEELTGLDFFCNLPDDTENTVEATLTLSDWNLQ